MRVRIKSAFFVGICLSLVPSVLFAADAKRPNILFVFADDWGRYASAYAKLDGPGTINDVVQTPNFDRVAGEGVLFRRAFVSAPSCTPCRSALLSGQHFWRTGRGAILRGAVWDESIPVFPLMLRDAGYHIGETYKVWSPGTPNDAPFGAGKYSYEKAGGRFNQFSNNVTKMVARGMNIDVAKKSLYDEVLANFDSFLAARPAGQPFCYWFGPTNVHRKWAKGSGFALWGIQPDDLEGKLPPFLPDVPEVREDLADYCGEIQALDVSLGLLLKRLEDSGELDNTLIVVSGDHGPPGFPHGKCNLYDFGSSVSLAMRWGSAPGGRVVDDLVSLTDLAPTFLELGGVNIPATMTGRSLVGILKSDNTGQVDPLRTAVFIGRERHVDSARADFMPYPQRAIRTRDALYIINFKPDRWPLGDSYRLNTDKPPSVEELIEDTFCTLPDEDSGPTKAWLVGKCEDLKWKSYFDAAYGKRPREELYDLKTDPYQTKNVAADPKYAQLRAESEQKLLAELKRTGDPRLVDDGRFFETPPLSGPAVEPKPAAQKIRPNVLFIAIDDQNDWIGAFGGHPLAKTPHIDRLARRGTAFLNAHCQAPLCNPSRTSLMLSQRPTTTGIYGLAPWFRTVDSWKDRVTLPQHFKTNGYRTLTVGKVHHGDAGGPAKRAVEFDVWGNAGGIGAKPAKKLIPPTPMGDHPLMDWGQFPHQDEDKGDFQVASWAVEQIRSAPRDEPFFLAAGFFLPHVPCYATQKWFDLYPDDDSVLPVVKADDRDDTPHFSWYLHWNLPEPRLKWVTENNQWRNLVRSYLACTSFVDSQVGRLLEALDQAGIADNTVVVLWGDHGWHLGEKGITGKNSLWDRATRVPLIFAGPAVARNARCEQPAELLDIYPTLVELCGLPPRTDLEGISLVPQLKDAKARRHRPAITSHNPGNHGIRTEKWRYIRYADSSEELYDMVNDPREWTNLAPISEYTSTIAELRKWIPEKEAPHAPNSAQRILTYDKVTDEAVWEGKAIRRDEPIPE